MLKLMIVAGKKIDKSPLTKLTRIGDVIHFEGPMLVLYANAQNGNLFLCDWVDKNKENNRWLVYKTTALALYQYIQGEISHRELFRTKYCNGEFWSFDVSSQLEHHNFFKIPKNDLPEGYFPQADAFFEKADCLVFDEIESFLKSAIFREFEKKMTDELAHTLASIKPKNSDSVKNDLFAIVKNSIENNFSKKQTTLLPFPV